MQWLLRYSVFELSIMKTSDRLLSERLVLFSYKSSLTTYVESVFNNFPPNTNHNTLTFVIVILIPINRLIESYLYTDECCSNAPSHEEVKNDQSEMLQFQTQQILKHLHLGRNRQSSPVIIKYHLITNNKE